VGADRDLALPDREEFVGGGTLPCEQFAGLESDISAAARDELAVGVVLTGEIGCSGDLQFVS
jgi:hypothetical protein